jgi:hypothetical protein
MTQLAIPGLTFDEASHTYHYQGVQVPSVTQVLKPLMNLDFVDPDVLQAAASFGVAVHKACELDDLKQLDEESLADELAPYLAAWRKFSRDYDVEWQGVEERVYHPQLRYAGTLDRRGLVRVDPRKSYRTPAIVDIKSGTVLYPSVGPQLSAYHRAIAEGSVTTKRLAVQLKPDATYVAKWHDDATDFALFCSLLTLRNWCGKHRITPNFQEANHA